MPGTGIPAKYLGNEQQIRVLYESNRTFRELWSDYCEIMDLADASGLDEELQQLRRDLEAEIDAVLGNQS